MSSSATELQTATVKIYAFNFSSLDKIMKWQGIIKIINYYIFLYTSLKITQESAFKVIFTLHVIYKNYNRKIVRFRWGFSLSLRGRSRGLGGVSVSDCGLKPADFGQILNWWWNRNWLALWWVSAPHHQHLARWLVSCPRAYAYVTFFQLTHWPAPLWEHPLSKHRKKSEVSQSLGNDVEALSEVLGALNVGYRKREKYSRPS